MGMMVLMEKICRPCFSHPTMNDQTDDGTYVVGVSKKSDASHKNDPPAKPCSLYRSKDKLSSFLPCLGRGSVQDHQEYLISLSLSLLPGYN